MVNTLIHNVTEESLTLIEFKKYYFYDVLGSCVDIERRFSTPLDIKECFKNF